MTRFWRDIRLIPIVLVATASLFVLKVSGLVFDGGLTLADRLKDRDKQTLQITTAESVPEQPKILLARGEPASVPAPRKPWAQEIFNFNGDASDVTGSVGASEGAAPAAKDPVSTQPPPPTKLEIGGAAGPLPTMQVASAGERAVLESLQERRRELDKRAHDLDMRENLIKTAEKRIEARLGELKALETRMGDASGAREKAEAQQFKSLVTMYESMKPKEAARIFDRLELTILLEVATQMNPKKMSEVLAQMSAEAAERLTVEIARRASATANASADALPKIEGKPRN
jgi:flagellar motility protein MotE (MotC chaperone)